jgi:hypothetical protein
MTGTVQDLSSPILLTLIKSLFIFPAACLRVGSLTSNVRDYMEAAWKNQTYSRPESLYFSFQPQARSKAGLDRLLSAKAA